MPTPSSRISPQDRKAGRAPLMARSLTVPLTARSPMLPPGKNSGRTTKESVEKARRAPPSSTTAEAVRGAGARSDPVRAGSSTCSTSSADIAPPPPCPITTRGRSRRGAGQVQDRASTVVLVSDNGAALQVRGRSRGRGGGPVGGRRGRAGRQVETPVEVVGRAGALAGDHRGAERGA